MKVFWAICWLQNGKLTEQQWTFKGAACQNWPPIEYILKLNKPGAVCHPTVGLSNPIVRNVCVNICSME